MNSVSDLAGRQTELRLTEQCERRLGVSVGLDDNLHAHAADEAVWTALVRDIRAAFGVLAEGLPLQELGGTPTIAGLAQMLDANLMLPPSVVVGLRTHVTAQRLFLIHAGGGYVFFYRALASRLAPDVSVYAVRASTADDNGQPFFRARSLEEVAARYADTIRTVQPRGPYALGGASFGGAVAFEIARRLRSEKEEVAPVLLFATLVRGADGSPLPSAGIAPLPTRIASHLSHAAQLSPAGAVQYVSQKLLRNARSEAAAAVRDARRGVRAISSEIADGVTVARSKVLRQAIPPELMYRCSLNLKTGNRLLASYIPRPCDVRIVLFRAAVDHDPEPCWRGLARGGMEIHDFPGSHLDLLEEPTVAETAAVVRRVLAPVCERP